MSLTWVRHLPNAVCCLVLISFTLSWYPYLHSSSFGASIPVPLLQNPHLNQNQLCNLQEQIWRLLGMIHLLLQSWPSTMEAMHRNQSMLQSRVRTALLFSLEISRYWTHFFCKVISLTWHIKPIPMAQENLTTFSLEKTARVVLESQVWRWRMPLQIIVL